ncbi:MAG TPA: GntR family transcriptional regulator [Burkholderiaceae bacterium]|nr:GntR family transcriptional regulator [Burkholderiaceae bacterium]
MGSETPTRLGNQEIYERIYAAIGERRLLPGTKLSEEKLARAFHASRTRIREVLMRLSQELIVELRPNRGAYVARPSQEDLRDVFAVRRALERAIAVELAERYSGHPLDAMRDHLDAEARARSVGDRQALARLTGEFHVRLAGTTGNRLYSDSVRRLVALTGLVIAQYDAAASSACPEHEHGDIVVAIESGDAQRAEQLMLTHLRHVETGIRPPPAGAGRVDFERIFGLAPGATPEPT